MDRNHRHLVTAGIVTVVVVLIGVGGYAVRSASDDDDGTIVRPAHSTEDYGIVWDAAAAGTVPSVGPTPVQVEIYEDFQCPVCQVFEEAAGDFLDSQVAAGAISVVYKPFSFLDEMGGSLNRYSHRATNAALCVLADAGVAAYRSMHDVLYENQPQERTRGPEDDELIEWAEQIGVTGIESCVDDETYVPWIEQAKSVATRAGVNATPTVIVDGQQVRGPTGGPPRIVDLQAAITGAGAS